MKRPRQDFSLVSSFIGSDFEEIISFIVHENEEIWLLESLRVIFLQFFYKCRWNVKYLIYLYTNIVLNNCH